MSTTSTFRASGPATDELSSGAEQFTVSGGDWDDVVAQIAERDEADRLRNDRIVLNMGPVHPSTHGVLRLVLEADGEVVTEVRVGTGYLHTGIEKNMEYRTWVQGETFVTRMDYVAPFRRSATRSPSRSSWASPTTSPRRPPSPACCSWSSTASPPTSWPWAPGATRWAAPRS